jgi:hypothetical protein
VIRAAKSAPSRLRRLPSWSILAGLVAASTAVRGWAGLGVPTPWIAPDEMIYGLLGRGLYETGHLAILGGPTPFYSAVAPLVVGLPLTVGDLGRGYAILKVLQALVMSLAAVPVYLWGRSLMAKRWALVAAGLTLALPGLAYSGLVMTEVAFYPALVLAAWAAARALESPTRSRQAVLMLASVLAVATRLQAVVLVPIFATAVALEAAIARRRIRLSAFLPTLMGAGLVAAFWVAWRLAAHGSLLGGYRDVAGRYAFGRAARFVGYHASDLGLLAGIFPLCALLVLLWCAFRRGERDAHVRAYLAVSAAAVFWFAIEVGVFASREVGLLAERDLIAVAPLLFVAFALWLDRGLPGGYWVRSLAAVVVAGGVLVLPLGTLVVPAALPDAFSLIPLEHLRKLTSLHTTELVLGLAVAAAAALFALTPRRLAALLPIVLVLALGAGSVSASREVASQARAQQHRLLGPVRRWIDERADAPVAYVYDGQAWWNAVWENVFWNRRITWVYDLPGHRVPGPLPQQPLEVLPTGELRPNGVRSPARFAVVPVNYALVGEQVASAPQFGTDRQGLGLWKIDLPLRLSTITTGLFPNGDVDRVAVLNVYGCRSGAFDLVMLVKQPQTARVVLDGRIIRRRVFTSATTWRLRLPVGATSLGSRRICRVKVIPSGLLGTTRFAFDRR